MEPLELFHMDLMGLMQMESMGVRNTFLCAHMISLGLHRLYFLREKSNTFDKYKMICTKIQNEKDSYIKSINGIRSDHEKEFESVFFKKIIAIA